MSNPPKPLPVGAKVLVAHGEGRPLLSLRGSRAVTAGSSYGHGPMVHVSVDENAALRVLRDYTDSATADARATAVALEHSGRAAVVAECSANLVGLFPMAHDSDADVSIVHEAGTEVSALALAMDDKTL